MNKNNTKTTYYVVLPVNWNDDTHKGASSNANNFVGYTDNPFIMKGFLSVTVPLFKGQYGTVDVDVFEYVVISEDELFQEVWEDTGHVWGLTGNDKIEIYQSDNSDSELALYLTPNYLEDEDWFGEMPGNYIELLWSNLKAIEQISDIVRFPEKITKIFEIMSDPYMILNATMYCTDLYSCRGTNVGSSIEHLLRSKWEKLSTQDDVDKAIESFAIYDIFDNTRAMYQFLENGFTFRYINDRCEESD